MPSGERRSGSFYWLASFFALFVLFLYGPMITIVILSFQGPQGGLAQIDETSECAQPVEGSIEPHEDDLLRAYDLCEARSAWGGETDGVIELLVAGLYHLSARTAADSVSAVASTRIVAPYLTIRAPLSINCRD